MHPGRALALATLLLLEGCAATSRLAGSHGRPSSGWLARGERLPDRGRGWQVLRTDAQGGHHWGTPRLVAMVRQVARAVGTTDPAVPLVVGDISDVRGGQIPRHASHRAGRDVDLLFFTRDALTDAPVITPEFVRYDRDGASVRWPVALRFDTARNWSIVESLVRVEAVGITRVFVAAWIRTLLLTHARAQSRPPWIIERAEALLHQPGDSAPHDDHFHVRVVCTPDERGAGCVDGGPAWTWLDKDWEKGESASADDDAVLALLMR